MSDPTEKARLYLLQERPADALLECEKALALDPEDINANLFRASALLALNRGTDALEAIQTCVSLYPDEPVCYYHLARVYSHLDQEPKALEAILESIRLDPEDVAYFALASAICADMNQWNDCKEYAERGLEIDPEHVKCLNLLGMSLDKLGKKDASMEALYASLAQDPENARAHEQLGHVLLSQGNHIKALEHFGSALRIEPSRESSRLGLVDAMSARRALYRPLLRFFYWMERFTPGERFGMIIALYFAMKFLRTSGLPEPLVYSVLGVYILFLLATWVARPLSWLALRFDSFGKHVLSPREKWTTNLFLAGFAWALCGLLISIIWPKPHVFTLMIGGLFMLFPVVATHDLPEGKMQKVGNILLISLALLWVLGFAIAAFGYLEEAKWFTGAAFFGSILSTWSPRLLQRFKE